MEEQHSQPITFVAGCAVEADYFYVAAYPDDYDPSEYIFSYLLAYLGRFGDDPWAVNTTDKNIVSVCVKKASLSTGRRLCSLSKEGEVRIFSNKDGSVIEEKIDEAGVRLGSRGYLTEIREIGMALYACGYNEQVYRRDDDGTWRLLTAEPLRIRDVLKDDNIGSLNSIDGTGDTDIYTCGDAGLLYHFDGNRWARIQVRTEEHLNCVRGVSFDEVWVCGNNGTLLKGNARSGFVDLSTINDNDLFWSLTKFKGQVYIATPGEELFVYDGATIQPVDTGFPSGLMTYMVDSVPDMLWSFSPKEIACFDGYKWTRINHPSNPVAD